MKLYIKWGNINWFVKNGNKKNTILFMKTFQKKLAQQKFFPYETPNNKFIQKIRCDGKF